MTAKSVLCFSQKFEARFLENLRKDGDELAVALFQEIHDFATDSSVCKRYFISRAIDADDILCSDLSAAVPCDICSRSTDSSLSAQFVPTYLDRTFCIFDR